MFTPQRKAPWTPATSTPKTASAKGKAVAFIDGPPPPPLGSLVADRVALKLESGNVEDWRKFKEAGLLDESSLERKDREALLDKISRLERELYDYQYNMGLLLIEKNNLASKNEELGQEFSEAREILKREQAAHLIALSEAGKREENLKRALDVEKKCVFDLERALHDMREEHSKIKDKSEATIVDVNAHIEVLEKKRLEVDSKSHSVNAKLAEADKKISKLDRKLLELETRESILKKERLTLTQEQVAHDSYFRKQKEDLLEWERKLQEAEQRLCDSRRSLNAREEKLHETERSCKEKEIKLEDLQQKIDLANATLKTVEEDVNKQSADLDLKEKKFGAIRCDLEMREKQLNEKEERLNARERVELQKLLNEHKANMEAKMQESELEMERKRKSLEEELESRRQMLDRKEAEVNHQEVKLGKREQALEKKTERLKEKEKDVEMKAKALKEQEKCLKAEEKKLEAEKKHLHADYEHLQNVKLEIEELRNDASKQKKQIEEERMKLENAEKERSEYLRLQSSLKQEMENVRCQRQLIEKEAEELKMEREKFEKDWEALDDKQAIVNKELEKLAEEKVSFERLQYSEEERLKQKKVEIEEYIQKETDSLKLEKESFEATMKHEQLILSQKVEDERSLMLQDYERQRQNLHDDMLKREKEWEKMVLEKEDTFEEMRSSEMRKISHLKEEAEKRMEEMESERRLMEKERLELELSKKRLEEASLEISKDIEALDNLSKNLKNQREQLVNERNQFSAFVEKVKRCKNCGDTAQAFLHHDHQLPTVVGPSHDQKNANDELSPLSDFGKKTLTSINRVSSEFGEQKSILRKCASIFFHLSPNKRTESADDHIVEEAPHSDALLGGINDNEGPCTSKPPVLPSDEPGPSLGLVNDSSKNLQSDTIVREVNVDNAPSVDNSNIDSEMQGSMEPVKSDLKSGRAKSGRKRGVRRTHTIKAVVEDAKAILGDVSELEPRNDSSPANTNSLEKTLETNTTHATTARKRGRSRASGMIESEQDVDHSEGKADSVTTGGRRKRRQTVSSAVPTPGQRRYNLRHHTATGTVSAGQSSGGKTKKDVELAHGGTAQPSPNPDDAPTHSMDVTIESDRRLNLVQDTTVRSVEFSSERIVRFDTTAKIADSNVDDVKSIDNTLQSEEPKSVQNILSEEVNGTSENVDDDDNTSIYHDNEDDGGDVDNGGDAVEDEDEGEDDDDDDNDDGDLGEDDDEYGHPGQASIGKKLWKFFIT